jgi:Tol biopolymer transport system component
VTSGTVGKLDGSAGLAWATDGKIVYSSFFDNSYSIWMIDPANPEPRQLTPSGAVDKFPSVTADGQWIVYEAGRDAPRIMKMPIEGGDTIQLTPAGARLPKISPEGRYVVCLLLDPETSRRQVAIFPIEGGIPVYRFDYPTTATFNNGFHWSPDGSSIVYRDFGTGLWQQPISGGMPQKVPDVPDERIYFFDWSRDGRQLALSYGNEFRDVVLISNFH